MKRFYIASLGTLAAIAVTPFVGEIPVVADLWTTRKAIAQNVQSQAQVQMNLSAQKQFLQRDAQGQQKVTWQSLEDKVTVQPGDVIRYTLKGENRSDRSVKNLVFNQPIPKQTAYILNSATVSQNNGANITYSIDNGKTFVEKPVVKVKQANGKIATIPAPAEAYTHIRWNFGDAVSPKAMMNATYQVKVR